MNNLFIKWLQENIQRLFTKSPLFFKIWMGISGAFVLVTAIPEALTIFKIDLPQLFNDTLQKIISGASTGMFLMALMTTQSKAVGVDVNGNILKKTDEKQLPFTSVQEVKEVAKKSDTINELVVTGKVDIAPEKTIEKNNP